MYAQKFSEPYLRSSHHVYSRNSILDDTVCEGLMDPHRYSMVDTCNPRAKVESRVRARARSDDFKLYN
jgi:hypothetical protein